MPDELQVEAELIRFAGNIKAAAEALRITRAELRKIVDMNPKLLEAAFEMEERRLDRAQAVIMKGMREGKLAERLQAAAAILRLSGKR
jgi:CRP-like cAMP-binding protein